MNANEGRKYLERRILGYRAPSFGNYTGTETAGNLMAWEVTDGVVSFRNLASNKKIQI